MSASKKSADTFRVESETIESVENCIEKTWLKLMDEEDRSIWWDEQELISSFFLHLKPLIDYLNTKLKKVSLSVIPEYAPKHSSYAKVFEEKYPKLNKAQVELKRTKKIDLGIAAFSSKDYQEKKQTTGMTRWFIKHVPLVLMEFKLSNKAWLLPGVEKDLDKLATLERVYKGIERVYFCYMSNEKLEYKDYYPIVKETGIENLRICHGTYFGSDWNITKVA